MMQLREPTRLLSCCFGLGKPSSNVPFMMPKRVAETVPNKQVWEFTGSGPFVFKRSQLEACRSESRSTPNSTSISNVPEPPRTFPGAKKLQFDRVEWRAIADHQQAVNALLAGEIDFIETPPHDLLPLGLANPNLEDSAFKWNTLHLHHDFRPNWLHKAFRQSKDATGALVCL